MMCTPSSWAAHKPVYRHFSENLPPARFATCMNSPAQLVLRGIFYIRSLL